MKLCSSSGQAMKEKGINNAVEGSPILAGLSSVERRTFRSSNLKAQWYILKSKYDKYGKLDNENTL